LSRRTIPTNAYQALTTGLVSAGADSIPVDVIGDLDFPGFVTLSPFSVSLREVIRFSAISGSNIITLTRGLAGSVGGVAHEHPTGAIVISAPTEQLIDDIFADIEDLENGTGFWVDADSAHVAAGDPHTAYLLRAGGTMTGDLVLDADPDADLKAATKQYVDNASAGAGLPAGTRLIFDQDAAPVGWTRDTSTVDDKMIRIVTGARADGGSWTQPVHDHTVATHTHEGVNHSHTGPLHSHGIGDHTHTIGTHSHTQGSTGAAVGSATAQENGGSNFSYAIGTHTHTNPGTSADGPGATFADGTPNTNTSGTGLTGTGGTGPVGGKALTTDDSVEGDSWRPLHRDMIIAVKD
jgi:hypothetical protein